jgi:hypothetical protein
VKVPQSVSGAIKNASKDKKLDENERVNDQLQSKGAIRPGQKVTTRYVADPIADVASLTSRVLVIDPDRDPNGTLYMVETPFSDRRN